MGTLVSLSAGSLVGVIASFVPMIFGPLAFPQAMGSPTLGENIVAASIPVFFLLFGGNRLFHYPQAYCSLHRTWHGYKSHFH
jgi:hypothetical protein